MYYNKAYIAPKPPAARRVAGNFGLAAAALVAIACGGSEGESGEGPGAWKYMSNGPDRQYAFGFAIGDYGYVGGGLRGPQQDLWRFDPAANTWLSGKDFPGGPTFGGIAFSIGDKAFFLQDETPTFWSFDGISGDWAMEPDFPGPPRRAAAAFAIGDQGYVVGGVGWEPTCACYRDLKDVWVYDASGGTWIATEDFPGSARRLAVGFTIGSKGYLGTGMTESDGAQTEFGDFYEYDPATARWTRLADYLGGSRRGATGVAIGDAGYVGLGGAGFTGVVTSKGDWWSYTPATGSWALEASFPGAPRGGAIGFSIGGRAYVGSGLTFASMMLPDYWEYTP